jgi:hypothetical protein
MLLQNNSTYKTTSYNDAVDDEIFSHTWRWNIEVYNSAILNHKMQDYQIANNKC